MMKFGAFERTVQLLYANVVPKPREECSKGEQLGVSFAAGYIAGIFCAVVSHPADNLVSKLNANKAATVGSVVSEMGMVALMTRGLPLRIIMVGTLTGLQWGIYDAFKVAVGLPTTGCVFAPFPCLAREGLACAAVGCMADASALLCATQREDGQEVGRLAAAWRRRGALAGPRCGARHLILSRFLRRARDTARNITRAHHDARCGKTAPRPLSIVPPRLREGLT